MKFKIKKIDKAQAVELLSAHVEKAVFGVFILGFLMFFVGALKQSPYPKTPLQLNGDAQRVSSKVDSSTFDPATDVPVVKDLPKAEEVAARWDTRESWNRPISDSKKRRPEPKYLALQDVHVATGYGAIPIRVANDDPAAAAAVAPRAAAAPPPGGGLEELKRNAGRGGLGAGARPGGLGAPGLGGAPAAAAPSGSTLKGMQWAVITGLVPFANQLKEYRSAFRDVRYANDQLDFPQYDSFEIERAEVLPDSAAVDDAKMKWVVIDRKRTADLEATFTQTGTDPVDPVFEDPAICRPLPYINGKEHDKSVAHPKIPVGAQNLGAGQANVVGARAAPAAGVGLRAVAAGAAGRNGLMGSLGGARAESVQTGPKVEYKLFRFFDYTVHPGKSYRYRVKLVLANPNYKVAQQYLANGQSTKGPTRDAAWSEISPEVAIPRGFSLLAGGVKKASGLAEQKIEVLVRMWDPKEAVDASRVAELIRGQVANFPTEDTPIEFNLVKPITFKTDTLVLDMTGGDSIPNATRTKGPGQLLVMEPGGRLAVKSELADLDTYESTKVRLKELKDQQDAAKSTDSAEEADDKPKKKKKTEAAGGGGLRGAAEAAGKGRRNP
ncbi:MAG TPA: hypothetical protein VGG64_30415 [Pirellulales bacterium]